MVVDIRTQHLTRLGWRDVIRTRILWLLVRFVPSDTLRSIRDRRRWRPANWLLAGGGQVGVLGGIVPRLRLSARHFDYASHVAQGVLGGSHEPMVQEALRRTVSPGDVVLDLGASDGVFSLIAAWLAGPTGRVFSFEPHRRAAEAIRAHATANGFSNVEVLELAVASRTGQVEIVITDDPAWSILAAVGDHPRAVARRRVDAAAVDDLIARGTIPAPDVIKVDVEGSEVDVIAGMSDLLRTNGPTLIVEMHDTNAAFVEAIAAYGYELTNLDGPDPIGDAAPNIHVLAVPPRRSARPAPEAAQNSGGLAG
jgi:FkbM family methyltransferase